MLLLHPDDITLNPARQDVPGFSFSNERLNAALLKAVVTSQSEAVRWLIRAGADLEHPTGGMTPLRRAAELGDYEICRLLAEAGAKVDAPDLVGNTALMMAAQHGYLRICDLLVSAGADPVRENLSGYSAIAMAEAPHVLSALQMAVVARIAAPSVMRGGMRPT